MFYFILFCILYALIAAVIVVKSTEKQNFSEPEETFDFSEIVQKPTPPKEEHHVYFYDRGRCIKEVTVTDIINKDQIPIPEERNTKEFCGWENGDHEPFKPEEAIHKTLYLYAIWKNKKITIEKETRIFPWYKWIKRTEHYWAANVGGHIIELYVDSHSYVVDGVKVRSITDYVDHYYRDDYRFIDKETLNEAAQKALDRLDEIEWCECKGGEGEYKEWHYYQRLKNAYQLNPIAMRLMVAIFDKDGTPLAAGTICSLLKNRNGSYGIMRISRTSEYYPKRLFYQMNLYRIGLMQCAGIKAKELVCLRLREDLLKHHNIPIQEDKAMAFLQEEVGHRNYERL